MNDVSKLRRLNRLRQLVCGAVLVGWAGLCQAVTLSYTGTFLNDNDKAVMPFTLTTAGSVAWQTWSFGGGVNGVGDAIAAGGFTPMIWLFGNDGSDPDAHLVLASPGGPCGAGAADGVTGYCWDVSGSTVLAAGSYWMVLTQEGNGLNGTTLSSGFSKDDAANFNYTASDFGGTGLFVLNDGSGRNRDGHWALDILGFNVITPVPLPATLWLLIPGLMLGRFTRSRAG
jgi:hypothetical protein